MTISGFMTATVKRRGSIDSSSAGVHVSGLKRLPPLRPGNQTEHGRVGRMSESCQRVTVQQHYRATAQPRLCKTDAGWEADGLNDTLPVFGFFSRLNVDWVSGGPRLHPAKPPAVRQSGGGSTSRTMWMWKRAEVLLPFGKNIQHLEDSKKD